ncbi:MAG TPA: CHAT domain-containing protein [Polyangia bacterium]|jgi:CHAT domain-containing protein/lipopolysaccharide biosynthesis regulator YciM|nr:CHAT domain-containing protein [Polyangia bacterium]
MQIARRAAVAVVLFCATTGRAEETSPDPPLEQTERDLTEARRLEQAGEYREAVPLVERALRAREKALGPNRPEVAECLYLLGELYRGRGQQLEAIQLHQRALQIRETALGESHLDVAQSLYLLTNLYIELGLYDQAEPLVQRALRIREAALGKNHPDVAELLSDIGALYSSQGSYGPAELLVRRAIQITEATLGKNHPSFAWHLLVLGNIYYGLGLYDRAEAPYQRAFQILEAAQTKKVIHLTAPLSNLADAYRAQGLYDRAEPLMHRVLRLREAALGKNHPWVALILHDLARLYYDKGDYAQAERLYLRAQHIQETAIGNNYRQSEVLLTDLAQLYLSKHQLDSVWPLLERAFTISEERLRKNGLAFSETRWASFLTLLRIQDENLYGLLGKYASQAAVRRLALMAALLHKGRSADEFADISRTIYRRLGQADREAFLRLRALRTELAVLSLARPENLSPSDYQARLKELETQGNALEGELALRSSLLRAEEQRPGPNDVIERVAAALPADSALVEIVAFSARPLSRPMMMVRASAQVPSPQVYAALVLLPDGDIRIADLGPAEPINGAVRRLLLGLSSRAENYLPAAQELYRRVFEPLKPLLGARRRLFMAPDGQLNLIPFDALHDGARFVADDFDITYLCSGQDLVRKGEAAAARSVVVFANPHFGDARLMVPPAPPAPERGAVSASLESSLLNRSASLDRFFAQDRAGLTHQAWDPLPGTQQEAEAIHRLFPQARLFLGPAATKQALLDVAAPAILHIATHGFFLGNTATPPGTRGRVSLGAPGEPPSEQRLSDPLLRAGLVLAGAQAALAAGNDPGDRRADATLATALELAEMDLWGTELVVLSACDTGRGEAKPGEGVYGLRRAFTVAGAETIVASLWKVSDQTTHKLMEDFYRRLKVGAGRAEALKKAMWQMREQHPHPYYWAPFILLGNGAPLRGPIPPPSATNDR